MIVKGKVFTGVLRGGPLLNIYMKRLEGMLGFECYPGTMGVKLKEKVNIEPYSTKSIDHILVDGSRKIDLVLAPVKIKHGVITCTENCWASQHPGGAYDDDVIELICDKNLREFLDVSDDEELEIEFLHEPKKKDVKKDIGDAVKALKGVLPKFLSKTRE